MLAYHFDVSPSTLFIHKMAMHAYPHPINQSVLSVPPASQFPDSLVSVGDLLYIAVCSGRQPSISMISFQDTLTPSHMQLGWESWDRDNTFLSLSHQINLPWASTDVETCADMPHIILLTGP